MGSRQNDFEFPEDDEAVFSEEISEMRCEDCELDEDEECLHCADRVMSGKRGCDIYSADMHRAGRQDGEDPFGAPPRIFLSSDEVGTIFIDDVGGSDLIYIKS